VAEDAEGKVSVTYNNPQYLKERHGVAEELIKNLAGAALCSGKLWNNEAPHFSRQERARNGAPGRDQ